MRLTGPVAVSTVLLESVAFTVMFAVPATVGVPLTTQPETLSPAGNAPAVIAQEYGDVPPATPIVAVYGTPTVPFGREDKVKLRVDGETVRVSGPVMVAGGLLESVTVAVRFEVPGTVGVPLMRQPESVKPAGNVPALIEQL